MHCASCCQNRGAPRRKCQPNDLVAGHFQTGFARWCDLYNTSFSRQGSSYIQIAVCIKCKALGTPQPAVVMCHVPLRIDPLNAIKA